MQLLNYSKEKFMHKIECCYDHVHSYMTGHSHLYAHVIIPLSQMLYLRIDDNDYWLNTENIAIVLPNVFHRIICTEKFIWFNIPGEMLYKNDVEPISRSPVFIVTDQLRPLIALIHYEAQTHIESDALRYLFYYLYSKLLDKHKLKSVIYIESHFSEPITLSELARLENYNPTYFNSWFKEQTGTTPGEYLAELRIKKAEELLINTKYQILDIALQCGYTNASAFTRAFRMRTGLSPQKYRLRNKSIVKYSNRSYWEPDVPLKDE